ncbi:MAG: alkaline phosphatase family protein [Actinobacteria bacterium]|nr:alkaline phosphatase family protein [Actinomycetota bacterium]MCL6094459.1 alkaline phosphatase family protein [Actinomycetota bacterium]
MAINEQVTKGLDTSAARELSSQDRKSTVQPVPVLPSYEGSCISRLVPALLSEKSSSLRSWLPEAVQHARQVVLLALDGLGWEQITERATMLPTLWSGSAQRISSVAPTTTATALTSLTTGLTPAQHGVVGYRMRIAEREVLNVLRWQVSSDGRRSDARSIYPASVIQSYPAFLGESVPTVVRAEFATTGFTRAHLGGSYLIGWRVASSLVVEVGRLVSKGEPFVYAYYDGVDKVAHEWGLDEHYDAELQTVDHLVAEILDSIGPGCALVITADHGQVQVGGQSLALPTEIMDNVELLSGEGRFRWLHLRPGSQEESLAAAEEAFGKLAWIATRDQIIEEGWLGGVPQPEVIDRLGDLALVAFEPVAFLDPADTGESALVGRHGSLTGAEMWVPLVAWLKE